MSNEEIRLELVTTRLDDGTPAVGVAEIGTGRELADLLSCTVKSSALGTTATLEVRVKSSALGTEEQRTASAAQREAMDRLRAQTVDAAVAWLRAHPDGDLEEFIRALPAQDARLVATKLRARWWSEALAKRSLPEALSEAQRDSRGGAT